MREKKKVQEGRDKNDMRANMRKLDCERKNKLKEQEKMCWEEINRQRCELKRKGQRKEDRRKPKKNNKCRHSTANSDLFQCAVSRGLLRALCCQPGSKEGRVRRQR